MPKKTPEPEQAPKADNYAKINMPAAFLTPHDIQTSDGRTFEKCFVSFPKVAQDAYKAGKAAERAAAKDGVSLAGEARDMETGKDALAGDAPAKSTKSRTGQDIAQ